MTKILTWLLFPALVLLASGCRPAVEPANRVVVWHQKTGAERVLFDEFVREYNRRNPGTRLVALYREGEEMRNAFIIAAVAGQGPDLVFGPADNVALFAETQVIRPWNEVFDAEFFERFTPEGVVSWKESPWMLADQIGNQLMLVYDRDMVSAPPATLGELIRMGHQLTIGHDGRTERYALTWNYAEPYFFIPFLTGFGGWIVDDEGNPTLDTPEMRAALQFVLDLRDKHRIIPRYEDYATANTMFLRHRAAMIINGPWSWAEYGVPERSMLALLPVNEGTGLPCRPIIAAKGYCLNTNVPQAKFPLVRDVIGYLTSEEVQMTMAERLFTTPVLKEAMNSDAFLENPVLQLALEQAKNSVPMPIDPRLRYIWDGIRGPYRRVFTGDLDPAAAATLMQREAERRIKEGMQ